MYYICKLIIETCVSELNINLKMGNILHSLYTENFKILRNKTRKKHELYEKNNKIYCRR